MARLIVKPDKGASFNIELENEVLTIGRSKKNDLALADQWLSRFHAEIRREDDVFRISDLNSRNGTYVNGQRIESTHALIHDDIVTLGDQQLRFENDASGGVVVDPRPAALDVAGTMVVPTAELLAAARAQEDTWDNMVPEPGPSRKQSLRDDSAIRKQNQILTALSQASMALISNRPVHELLEFVLELAFKVIKAERGVLMIDEGGSLMVKAVRTASGKEPDEEIRFSRTIADKVTTEKVSILTNNTLSDPRFNKQESIVSLGIRSAMCVPLWHDGGVTGLIYVDSPLRESFSQDDLTLLTSLANVAAIKLENSRLLEEMIEKKRMERELELAGDIQQGLLPSKSPEIVGWDFVGTNTPCYTIGGDYYDFIQRPTGLAVALGDVSGKGAGAALMMMVLRATVHFASQRERDVVDIITQTNGVIYDNSPAQFYVTFFLTELDTGTGRMRYVNAGHIPPILYRHESGSVARLEQGGTVLGLFEDPPAPFDEGTAELLPGDILVVFTDGISEAWGADEEEYGEERLAELVSRNASLSASELESLIQQDVETYTSGQRATDDRTVIVVKRTV